MNAGLVSVPLFIVNLVYVTYSKPLCSQNVHNGIMRSYFPRTCRAN